jgi:hypothetical protein
MPCPNHALSQPCPVPTTNKEQQTKNNKQRTTNKEQRTTNNKQQTTKKMKHISTSIILIFLFLGLSAQEFDVRSFRPDQADRAAQRFEKRTVNDEPAALVKILTNIRGMQFDSNQGIVDVEHKEEGYWVYVAPRERRIRLLATGFIPLDVDMPEPARSSVVYLMTLASTGLGFTETDLVTLNFRFNEPNVYIRRETLAPVEAPGSSASLRLTRGRHSFRFSKEGFLDQELTLDVQDDQDVQVTLERGQSATTIALRGWVTIESNPSGADVYLNDQRVGVTPYQQMHVPGSYNLTLRYQLYLDHSESFTMAQGQTINLPAVNMVPRFGYWQVTSDPAGAEVLLNGQSQGTTPLARAQIASAMHQVTIRYPLHHDHEESFLITDGDEKQLNVTLRPAFGNLTINSEPQGAKVFIGGREVGTTPYRNPQQPSGTYNLRLEKELYADFRGEVTIIDGRPMERNIPMIPNYGTLNVTAEQAGIFLNGRRVATGSYTAQLAPGRYELKATRDRHRDADREVFITVGRVENITLTPEPRVGAVNISSQPFESRGAEIFVNGTRMPQTSPASFPLLMGSHEITLRKSGYLDASRRVEIREGQQHDLAFQMQTFAGSLQQQANRQGRAKWLYGSATLLAAGAGGYFTWSAHNLGNDYKTATKDATTTYNQMEDHNLYSYIAFGTALPLGIMYMVKAGQQNNTKRRINVAAIPTDGGAVVGMRIRIGP